MYSETHKTVEYEDDIYAIFYKATQIVLPISW